MKTGPKGKLEERRITRLKIKNSLLGIITALIIIFLVTNPGGCSDRLVRWLAG